MTAPIAVSSTIPRYLDHTQFDWSIAISRVTHGAARATPRRCCWSSQSRGSRGARFATTVSAGASEWTRNCMRRERQSARDCRPPDDDASSLAFGLDGQSRRMDGWMDRWIDGQTPRVWNARPRFFYFWSRRVSRQTRDSERNSSLEIKSTRN